MHEIPQLFFESEARPQSRFARGCGPQRRSPPVVEVVGGGAVIPVVSAYILYAPRSSNRRRVAVRAVAGLVIRVIRGVRLLV